MKLVGTIRLDPSDTFIFPSAAEPGEWPYPAFRLSAGLMLRHSRRAAFCISERISRRILVGLVDLGADRGGHS